MKLTEKEKEIIEKLRKEEENQKPYREAFLKHDLWSSDVFDRECNFTFQNPFRNTSGFPQMTHDEATVVVEAFKKSFTAILNKGDRFVSYLEDGEELWYDYVGYGIEGVDNKWAKKHLENFVELRKLK